MKIVIYFRKFFRVLTLNQDFISFLGTPKTLYFVSLALIISLLNSFNYVALIPLASRVIDSETSSGDHAGMIGTLQNLIPSHQEGSSLYALGAAIIITFLIKLGLNVLFSHHAGGYGEDYLFDVRKRMIKMIEIKHYELGAQSSGQVLHLNNMVARLGSFNWATLSLAIKLLSALFLFVSLILVSPKLALFSFAFSLVWALILLPVLNAARKYSIDYTDMLKKTQAFFIEEIEGREVIKIFGLSSDRFLRFNALRALGIKANERLSDVRAFVSSFQESLIVITGVVLLCFARQNNFQIGFLVAYGYMFSKFIGTLNEASAFLNAALEAMPPSVEVLDYIGPLPRQDLAFGSAESNVKVQSLAYKNIVFSWSKEPLFEVPLLPLKRGDRVLIRGKNGEGKSTLLKVMAGLIKSGGELIINDSKHLPLSDIPTLYSRFTYLPQTVVVFDDFLWKNIILNSGKSLNDVQVLSQNLGIDLEEYFPNWKNYRITESGRNLSGGEMQIIAIFRALIRDFDVLFIDEFTNHLSQKVARSVDEYLQKLNDSILICISHSEVNFSNREYVLEQGALRLTKGV